MLSGGGRWANVQFAGLFPGFKFIATSPFELAWRDFRARYLHRVIQRHDIAKQRVGGILPRESYMFGLGMQELVVVGVVAILLFGKRLPEVARSLGSSYRELRRNLSEFQSSFNMGDIAGGTTYSSTPPKRRSYDDIDDHDEATAPRFEPPAAPPQPSTDEAS